MDAFLAGFTDEIVKIAQNDAPSPPPAKPVTTPPRVTKPVVKPVDTGVRVKTTTSRELTPERWKMQQAAKKVEQQKVLKAKTDALRAKREAQEAPRLRAIDKFNELNDAFTKKWGGVKLTRENRAQYRKEKAAIAFDKIYDKKTNTYTWKDPEPPKAGEPGGPIKVDIGGLPQ